MTPARAVLFLAAFAASCAPVLVTPPTVLPGERRVETAPMPSDAQTVPLPEGIPDDQRVEAIEQGVAAPFPGVLMGEGRAARLSLVSTGYDEMRVLYEQDKKVWTAQRELYETRLALADKAIHDLQPSWWTQHAFSLGLVGGLTLGVAAAVVGISVAR